MTRKQAETEYKKALAEWNTAANGNSEESFLSADAKLTEARRNLVAAEIAEPTYKETKKQNELLKLRNRGYDI